MTVHAVPLKYLAGINERGLPEDTDPDRRIRYVDISSVGRGDLVAKPSEMRFSDAPSRARRLVKPGDTIVSTVRTYLRAVWPVSGTTDDLVVSTGFAVLTPRSVDPAYFSWWVRSDVFIEEVVARSVGVSYPAINATELGELPVRIPGAEEQRAIADFLDTESARIDALITKKRRMIELLDERYESRCASTLLAGLDPVHGTLEGRLVGGWEVAALGVLVMLHRGFDLPLDERQAGAVPVVSSGGVSGCHSTAMCSPPGVVTGRYGTIGEVFFVDKPYWPLNTTLFVSDFRGNDERWVFHLLKVLPLDYDAAKSAVTGINRNVIGGLRVPRPPVDEQRRMADVLDRAQRGRDRAVGVLERQVGLLQERRQALITAAVTGELALPGVAA